MKKLLLIAAVASMSAPAFASKARLNALGNAAHLKDPQTIFNNPSDMVLMSDFVTFEAGPTDPATAYNLSTTPPVLPSNSVQAEGGFVRSAGDAKYMAYLGRKSDATAASRSTFGFLGQENPIEIDYAMKGAINWGAGVSYSSSDKKSASQKQSAYGIRLGANTDMWDAFFDIGLFSEATGTAGVAAIGMPTADADAKLKGTSEIHAGAGYRMENLYPYLDYKLSTFKLDSAANDTFNGTTQLGWNGAKFNISTIEVGIIDHNKIEGGQWFYGAAYRMAESKRDGMTGAAALEKKVTTSSLPFLLGVEYDATSWATLRASVTQNVLLGTTKTETQQAATSKDSDTIANDTTVAAGVGLKFNKWVIDGSWSAGKTGNVDVGANDFMTNVALTYMF